MNKLASIWPGAENAEGFQAGSHGDATISELPSGNLICVTIFATGNLTLLLRDTVGGPQFFLSSCLHSSMAPKSITKAKMSKGAATAPTKQFSKADKRAQAPGALKQNLSGTEEQISGDEALTYTLQNWLTAWTASWI